jgi:transaldolase
MSRLQQLHDAGVSIWLDTLSRELLERDAFAALIADSAVTGAISNPTTFAKAIAGSDAHDDQLRAAVASGERGARARRRAVLLRVLPRADRSHHVQDRRQRRGDRTPRRPR